MMDHQSFVHSDEESDICFDDDFLESGTSTATEDVRV